MLRAFARILALLALIVRLFQKEVIREEVRKEITEQHQHASEEVTRNADQVRENVARLADDELDRRLRRYFRDCPP